ncbi:hypothetical protein DLJ53_05300 [Acuticoccus sediminis]|uniref:UPF0262 protein DLJ53_05300 n=1 Tax=Acuticoccus sediminis TaxID=2184697 RepID=A0A8B2NUM5_9HYPH|nr:UPF0262 family protein [Acuticoccus sediminis]RAI03887.1 hypothetical protein DLJ53_05300 [Acuticoccus sediminis]
MTEPTNARLIAVTLDEASIDRGTPDVEHERAVAVYDLLEENVFRPSGLGEGPYRLVLSIQENRLVFTVQDEAGGHLVSHMLSLTPLRKVVKDYFLICESYFSAIRTAAPAQIEAIDMGRRGVHDEGSRLLAERLEGKIEVDHDTARRLFTLICALHFKG